MAQVTLKRKWFMLSFLTVLFVFSGSAWSYDFGKNRWNAAENVSRETFSKGFGAIPVPERKALYCSSLLNSLDKPSSAASAAGTRRTAGKVAALGMILGARYALEPKDQKLDAFKPSHPAQIIMAYRQCRKANSLRTASLK